MKRILRFTVLMSLLSAAFATFPANAAADVAADGCYGKVDMVLFPGGHRADSYAERIVSLAE